jgi:hypothetical protein
MHCELFADLPLTSPAAYSMVSTKGGGQTVFWIIDSGGGLRDVNDVVGYGVHYHTQATRSVVNPTPGLVRPGTAWEPAGQAVNPSTYFDYFENN